MNGRNIAAFVRGFSGTQEQQTKPLLKFIACHRGAEACKVVARITGSTSYHRIARGPLKRCITGPAGTFKLGRGYVLQFKPVIRVDL